MPETVAVSDVPTFTRTGQVSKYADIFNYVTALLADDKRRVAEAVKFLESDGIAKDNWGQIATGLRNVAKQMGHKLAIVYRDDALWVRYNGEYIAMTPEQIDARNAKRAENAAKLQAAAQANVKGGK